MNKIKLITKVKKEFVKYRLLLLALVGVLIPLPIISFFKEASNADKVIQSLQEGEIARKSIVSEIDTYVPNIYGIEYEKKLFPLVLKREKSAEKEVDRITEFIQVLSKTQNPPQQIEVISKLPRELVVSMFTRIISETVVIDKNKLPPEMSTKSNVIVVSGTNVFSPKAIVFFPITSAEEIRKVVETILGEFTTPYIKEAIAYVLFNTMTPNVTFSLAFQEAKFREYLKLKKIPSEIEIRKGEEIIKKGEVIKKEDIEFAKRYIGEVKKKNTVKVFLLEVFILILAIFSTLLLSTFRSVKHIEILAINASLLMLSLYPQLFLKELLGESVLLISLCVAFALINTLISGKISTLIVGIHYLLVTFLMISQSYTTIIYWLVLIVIGSFMTQKIKRRSDFVAVAMIMLGLMFPTYLLTSYLEFLKPAKAVDIFVISFINVFSNILLAFLILPIYEYFFRVATPFKLYELSSLDNLLLRELLEKAPGNYYHSLNVSILAESAAEAIGANSLLAKVGALYHDIGKLENPNYFTENIGGKTREDVDPFTYTEIIKRHPSKGQEIAKKFRLPIEIEKIIQEHHGSSVISYFYNKAIKENPNADIEFFRYKTPIPTSKESGIVFICDKIEARIRSLTSNQRVNLETLQSEINNIIYNQIITDELSKSELTLRDINEIRKQLNGTLTYILHQRIEYPK
ncbi:MAG: HDIG domain-containing metalloprotein [Brevinematia bacterium]